MSRYFIEVSYKGTAYAGFQVQENANTIQAECEKAFGIYYRCAFSFTGSSRTDAGVHARQNYFHTDSEVIDIEKAEKAVYHINAILPSDIVLLSIKAVREGAHCRFDALSRSYIYTVYSRKDPFLVDRAFYCPFPLDMTKMKEAAGLLMGKHNFEAFAKRNSQVFTYDCSLMESRWVVAGEVLEYRVRANRFLRGMVRGLAGTMLRVGRGIITVADFEDILGKGDSSRVDFSVPGHGLCLDRVEYAVEMFL